MLKEGKQKLIVVEKESYRFRLKKMERAAMADDDYSVSGLSINMKYFGRNRIKTDRIKPITYGKS